MVNYLKLIPEWLSEVIFGPPRRLMRRHSTAPFLVIGHRGSPCFEVENTMASFQRAVEQEGANGLECDLCLTRDRQIVIWHDWDPDAQTALLREAGLEPVVGFRPCPPDSGELRRPVCELTLDELCTHFCYRAKDSEQTYRHGMPRLDELLAWVAGRRDVVALFLDIKVPVTRLDLVPVMMESINRLLDHYRPSSTIIFECAAVEVLQAMQAHSPRHHYALDIALPAGFIFNPSPYGAVRPALEHGNSYATLARPYAITLAPWTSYRRVVRRDIRLLNRLQRRAPGQLLPSLIGFTIDEEKELRTLVRMGMEGMQTNRPALLRKIADDVGVRVA